MARRFPDPLRIERDGTSQSGRVQAALDPGYVAVDERSPLDLLWFAAEYAWELRYHDKDDRPAGDFRAFLSPDHDGRGLSREEWRALARPYLAELAALIEEPAQPTGVEARRLDRPHLALFLAFLRLLRHPRDRINTFTRRHLEFYYEQVLRMTRKAAVSDRVHVLFRLAAGVDQARVPAGSLLRAGKDRLGKERIYRTDRDLVVSRAGVARLCSAYAQKEIVGIREAWELRKGTPEEAVFAMLEIALGEPRPGDPLPRYKGREVTYALLIEMKRLLDFAGEQLFMDLQDLRAMMRLKRQRDQADDEWRVINGILEQVGRTRRPGEPDWRLDPADPRDFEANLAGALGGAPDFERDGLPGVNDINDLHDQRTRQDVIDFVRERLFFTNHDDFVRMMQIKVGIDYEWREINRILERAGQRKRPNDPSYRLSPEAPTAFSTHLAEALGPVDFATLALARLPPVSSIDDYHDAVLGLESYFDRNAEQIRYLLDVVVKLVSDGVATAGELDNVYRLLAEAHTEKVYAARRRRLREVLGGPMTEADRFYAMLGVALGEDAASAERSSLLPSLMRLVGSIPDRELLESIEQRLGRGDRITSDEWAEVYRIVELAQRARVPVAQRETWLDLHAASDATSVVAARAGEAGAEARRWKTFGQRPPVERRERPPPGVLGWAISSPMLWLRQGTRRVVLTLGFRAEGFDAEKLRAALSAEGESPLAVELSTEKGWLALSPTAATMTVDDYQGRTGVSRALEAPLSAIQIALTLGADAAATAPPSLEAMGIATRWPVLRLTLRPIWSEARGQFIVHHESFRDLVLEAVHVRAEVQGLTPTSLRNDEAVLNPERPFEPFGTSPAVGSRFYVGDPELVIKRLESLSFRLEWRGAPHDLAAHYANYENVGAFTTRISLVDNHVAHPLTEALAELFASPDAARSHAIVLSDIPGVLGRTSASYPYEPLAELPAKADVSAWPRHIRWELTPTDFKHQVYPAVATRKALEMSAAIARNPASVTAASYQVNPPYTPRLTSLGVDYTSSVEVLVAGSEPRAERLFHVHPFGVSALEAEAEGGKTRFLPRYDHEGELYIGIERAKPPQTLSLLFQMADGSANPDLPPVPVVWSYLSGDRWLTLHDGKLLSDTTRGLIDSGIVEIALPPAERSTRLPGDLTWIRAAIPYHADSVCDAVAIYAQAVSATFVDRGDAPEQQGHRLPERSITRLVERLPQIAAVEQPYASRGGRAAEVERDFATRVSERLRHKQRALTIWDYERLVLERFPELYKVKCIPGGAGRDGDSLGAVELVVIPGLRGQSTGNPFEPKVPASLLAEIEAYLADKCPAEAALRVRNAHFVPVKVRVGVRFRRGQDEGFCKKLLNEELNRFLSPWAYDEGADLSIGGKIFANSIVNFIDERDYVDYVAAIKLFSYEDGRTPELSGPVASEGHFVETRRPDGVLVAAQQHEIDVIPEVGYQEESFTGINYMKIELDFVVAGSP